MKKKWRKYLTLLVGGIVLAVSAVALGGLFVIGAIVAFAGAAVVSFALEITLS